jgi:hypothetical protein
MSALAAHSKQGHPKEVAMLATLPSPPKRAGMTMKKIWNTA